MDFVPMHVIRILFFYSRTQLAYGYVGNVELQSNPRDYVLYTRVSNAARARLVFFFFFSSYYVYQIEK